MKKRLSIRDSIYIEDLKKAAQKTLLEKLRLCLELSDFCRYLQNRKIIQTIKR